MQSRVPVCVVGLNHAYERAASVQPTPLEVEQRKRFTERMRELIADIKPTIIASENPDTNNSELLAVYPQGDGALSVCLDIPLERKIARGLCIFRSEKHLCPYVDGIRERFWRSRLYGAVKAHPHPRILLFCGSLHLYRHNEKPVSFPDKLKASGYSVSVLDLRKDGRWNESWVRDWKDPSPLPGTLGIPCCIDTGTFDFSGKCRMK